MESILASLITGVLALVGVIITNNRNQAKMDAKLDKQQAITDVEIKELTREVREHNNYAHRVPVVEEQIKVINHRIEDLENLHKGGGGA